MRLIDADSLLYDWYDWFYCRYGINCAEHFKGFVEEAKTIECRDQAKWIIKATPPDITGNQIVYCSNCQTEELVNANKNNQPKFCPNCGAKMQIEYQNKLRT